MSCEELEKSAVLKLKETIITAGSGSLIGSTTCLFHGTDAGFTNSIGITIYVIKIDFKKFARERIWFGFYWMPNPVVNNRDPHPLWIHGSGNWHYSPSRFWKFRRFRYY